MRIFHINVHSSYIEIRAKSTMASRVHTHVIHMPFICSRLYVPITCGNLRSRKSGKQRLVTRIYRTHYSSEKEKLCNISLCGVNARAFRYLTNSQSTSIRTFHPIILYIYINTRENVTLIKAQ